MIDIDKCKKVFFDYIEKYDMSDSKINLKVIHTLQVLNVAAYIADSLDLDEENKKLCLLIALLHDIGRFEQLREYGTFDDSQSIDHANYGVKILFEDGIIRRFLDTKKYDNIIYYSIKNHNKYKIEDELNDLEMLHAKIIRDADKIDNFRVKDTEDMITLLDMSEIEIGKQDITDDVYNDFMNHKLIKSHKNVTRLDWWISFIAFIFDMNFQSSLEYLNNRNYIENLFNRIKCSNIQSKSRMNDLKDEAYRYVKERINLNRVNYGK